MRIIKFNESKLQHESALEELNLTTKDMDAMLYKLNKYSSYLSEDGINLLEDLENLKKGEWSKLRKWKIENIFVRYKKQLERK